MITGKRPIDTTAWLGVALVAIYPHLVGLAFGIVALVMLIWLSHRRFPTVAAVAA